MFCRQHGKNTPLSSCAVNTLLYNAVVGTTEQHPLAPFIQVWLRERKATQLWLAQQAGIPHSTISALFNRRVVPRPDTLRKLGAVMGVPVGQLLVLAGHLSEEEYQSPIREIDLARLYEIGDLTKEEWEQVRDFARYVRTRRG